MIDTGAYDRSCANCAHLDKQRKEWNDTHYCYIYGCKSHGRVCGWVRDDKDLKLQGCSDFKKQQECEQISIFEVI